MVRPKTRVKRTCDREGCGVEYEVEPSRLAKGQGRFCSAECYRLDRTGRKRGPYNWSQAAEQRRCVVCGETFDVGFGTGRPLTQERCSTECQRAGRYRTGAKANDLTPTEAAYIAGLVDGEGSFILYKRRDVVAMKLTISNTNLAGLEWVLERTGVGHIVGEGDETSTHKARYAWRCNADAAYSVIEPQQADLAMDVQQRLRDPAQKADRSWMEPVRQRMKALNRRGPSSLPTS